MDKWIRFVLAGIIAFLVSACGSGSSSSGGGPGDGSDVLLASTETFNLRAAWIAFLQQPKVLQADTADRDSRGVPITGRGTEYNSPMFPATFEGRQVWAQSLTAELFAIRNGEPNTSIASWVLYFDSDYTFVGMSGNSYTVVDTPSPFPASVRIGNAGLLYTATNFTDASKTAVSSTTRVTYAIEPDTANSVIVVLTTLVRGNDGAAPVSNTARYRLTSAGTLTRLSETVTDLGPTPRVFSITYRQRGSASPTASIQLFNLRAAYQNDLQRPQSLQADVTGRINDIRVAGQATVNLSPLYAATLEGRPVLAQSFNVSTQLLANGEPITLTENSVSYYDAGYNWLGATAESYRLANSMPIIPQFVREGDGGLIYTATEFSDAIKSTITGTEYATFAIEADTATSVILVLNTTSVNTLGVVTESSVAKYRLTSTGTTIRLSETTSAVVPSPVTLTVTYRQP